MNVVTVDGKTIDLNSREGYAVLCNLWTRSGWVQKYSYGFTWLGRPIIQMPEDMIRIQEAICEVKPDIILETGIAHGGSLVYFASICKLLGKGRVIGVDIEIRKHNRAAIEAHPLSQFITMFEGSSIDPGIVQQVKSQIEPGAKVMLILDSNHSRSHVAAELEAYASLVTPGSYILVQDGVMQMVAGMNRAGPDWSHNNPVTAIDDFLAKHPEFSVSAPKRPFDETLGTTDCSHHPRGWLKRLS
jgi:cephalosporin hydroxylase